MRLIVMEILLWVSMLTQSPGFSISDWSMTDDTLKPWNRPMFLGYRSVRQAQILLSTTRNGRNSCKREVLTGILPEIKIPISSTFLPVQIP